jgi:hypothetical protein
LFVYLGAAALLYLSAWRLGWLSDDFGHVTRANEWSFGFVTPSFFRPLPLFAWAVLFSAGLGAVATHALNIVLHATNAWLVSRLFDGWFPWHRGFAWIAGGLFLGSPLALEAVAWSSGVFDVTATMLILTMVLSSRDLPKGGAARQALFWGAAILALACKETAVVAPVLVLIDAWVRGERSRTILIPAVTALVAAAGISAVRLVYAFGVSNPPLSKYVVQRSLFETFGALAAPWHADVLHAAPWLTIAASAVIVVTVAAAWLRPDVPSRPLVAGAAWVVVSVAPIFPIVVIGVDLQASRYLYLGSAAWAAAITGIAATVRWSALRRGLAIALIALCVGLGFGTVRGLRAWNDAARVRDRVFAALQTHPAVGRCPAIAIRDLPDNVRGAYVFRVDAEAAFRLRGIRLVPDAEPGCTLTWRDPELN